MLNMIKSNETLNYFSFKKNIMKIDHRKQGLFLSV